MVLLPRNISTMAHDIALVVDAGGTLVERYLYGDGVDNVLSREKSGTVVWSLGDRQGSVVDLVNQDGTILNHFVYDGFGNRTGTTAVDFRYGYTGRELDGETGLYYYRARYYDSSLGRFISEDPIGFSAGDTNLYRYVNNSPTNFTDPTGMTLSGWGEDLLYGADQLAAGFADATTFGISSKIREQFYGKLATQNHKGGFFVAGNIIGGIAGFALGYGAEAQAAKLSAGFINGVRTYDAIGTGIGVVQGVKNVNEGTATGWDLLNFLPVAGFAAKNGRKIGGALLKAGDNVTDAALRGIDNVFGNQPRLATVSNHHSATGINAVEEGVGFQHSMAMKSQPEELISSEAQKYGAEARTLNLKDLKAKTQASNLRSTMQIVYDKVLKGNEFGKGPVLAGVSYIDNGVNITRTAYNAKSVEESFLHPLFDGRLKSYEKQGLRNGLTRQLLGQGDPGTHAEVIAASKILRRIEKMNPGLKITEENAQQYLSKMMIYNTHLTRNPGGSLIRCDNCQVLTKGILSLSDLPVKSW